MASVHVERLDHFGLLAHVIQDLGLIPMLDARLVPDEPEESTPGEAVAGMLLNGLGFAHRPLALTPQFCANQPLELLGREERRAELCQRLTLGRTLEESHAYGCARLLRAWARAVCVQDGMAQRCPPLDTTSCALTGDSVPESDAQAMPLTHGYATDHRPALQPAVLALLVSPEGGGPMVRQSWAGKAADTQMFQERAAALVTAFAHAPTPR